MHIFSLHHTSARMERIESKALAQILTSGRKTIVAILAMATTATWTMAQTSSFALGYCDGTSLAKSGYTSNKSNAWLSGAIFIPSGTINTYAGNTVKAIRAGINSRQNIDSLRVWIRSSLDGENLAEGLVTTKTTPKLSSNWNEVALATPFDIQADNHNGLYIGYSIHQKASSDGLSVVTPGESNGLFVLLPAADGSTATWKDRSQEGVLSIQALVYGDNIPQYDLSLKNVNMPVYYSMEEGKLTVSGTVKNIAAADIKGFNVRMAIDGSDKTATGHADVNVARGATADFSVELNPSVTVTGTTHATITVDNPDGKNDANPTDNTLQAEFTTVSRYFTHNVLTEEFTTEGCGNCPEMARRIEEALQDERFGNGRIVNVSRHSGYGEDWLTQPCDRDYLWFFEKDAQGQTDDFAPALMIDRSTAINGDGKTVVVAPQNASTDYLKAYWNSMMNIPALVSVGINTRYDSNRLTVNVSGEKSELQASNPHLCVLLVEDNIKAHNQTNYYSGPSGSDFVHQHVVRAYNSTWGEPVEWDGNSYSYQCSFDIDKSWKQADMKVVAFIYNYNNENHSDCAVLNSAMTDMPSAGTDGIGQTVIPTTTEADNATAEYFTLSGMKVLSTQKGKGIYIVKKNGKTYKSAIVK